jgi:hypothetical protein
VALKLFAAAGSAFLLALLGLGLTGGGRGHGVLPEPINSVFVVVTWLLWLALLPLLIAACVAAVVAITTPCAPPSGTEAGWPADTFTGTTLVEAPALGGEPEQPRTRTPQQSGILLALLVMTIGGVALFVRAGQRPAPDDVGMGLLLLGLGVVAWLVTVGTRAVRFLLGLAQRYRMR